MQTARRAVGTALVGALLAAAVLQSSCDSRDDGPAGRSLPPPVEMSLGKQTAFYARRLKGGDSYHFVSGKDGALWVLRQELLQPLMAAKLEKGVEPIFEAISPEGWRDVDRVGVSNDNAGNPVVFMMGCLEDARDTRVVVREYDGQSWREPVQLDAFDGSGTFGSMLSMLDSNGRTHVVYDRRLEPRESYGIMEGHFPDKCFHAWSDGKNWTRSRSTTGKGKYYVDPTTLSELSDGKVCLVINVRPFAGFASQGGKYPACQLWDGERWSDITKQLPEDAVSEAEAQSVSDYWGNVVSWSRQGGRHICTLNKHGGGSVETLGLLSEPILTRDTLGRIIVGSADSSQGEVHIWNGNRWVEKRSYPVARDEKLAQILCNPDGNVLLIHQGESRVTIQRVKLGSATSDTASREGR
jgi:hypothetical protein